MTEEERLMMEDERRVGKMLDKCNEMSDRLLKAPAFSVLHLVLTVAEMRQTQKAYFKTKDRSLLICSKELESLVDKELAELLK